MESIAQGAGDGRVGQPPSCLVEMLEAATSLGVVTCRHLGQALGDGRVGQVGVMTGDSLTTPDAALDLPFLLSPIFRAVSPHCN